MGRTPRLTQDQEKLLALIVEASRAVPREEFYFFSGMDEIQHSGLPETREVFPSDFQALREGRLIHVQSRGSDLSFEPTALAFDVYGQIKKRDNEPTQRVESNVRAYFDSERFREVHPQAFQKWAQAEELLWSSDAPSQLTTIGHYVREAMQEFAASLMLKHGIPEVGTDKAKTINRLKLVLDTHNNNIGTSENELLEALLRYWCAVEKLTQRQEHGALREKQDLTWGDARRLVFQLMVVMFELEASLLSAERGVTPV
jgi:hypothetical protein